MIETSESIKSIAAALLKFQGAVEGVEKNRSNPAFKSRYANLEAVRDTAVPELQKVGLLYTQSPGAIVDGVMAVTTMIIHAESGEWMKFEGDIALGKRDPQGVGSAITYMQRYSLMAALGLPPVDDDGEGAMDRSRPADTPPKPSARPVETERPQLSPDEEQKIAQIAANIDFALEQSGPNLAKVWKENWSTIQALPKHMEDALTLKKDTLKAKLPK